MRGLRITAVGLLTALLITLGTVSIALWARVQSLEAGTRSLYGIVQELSLDSITDSIMIKSLDDEKTSLGEVQSAMRTGGLVVPAGAVEVPFFCSGQLVFFERFGRGLRCSRFSSFPGE